MSSPFRDRNCRDLLVFLFWKSIPDNPVSWFRFLCYYNDPYVGGTNMFDHSSSILYGTRTYSDTRNGIQLIYTSTKDSSAVVWFVRFILQHIFVKYKMSRNHRLEMKQTSVLLPKKYQVKNKFLTWVFNQNDIKLMKNI